MPINPNTLPPNVLAVTPPEVLRRIARVTFGVNTLGWRGAGTVGTANAGQLAANALNKDATLVMDGNHAFVAVRGLLQSASAADVLSGTTSLLVERMNVTGGDDFLNQATYASAIFDNAASASDLADWPAGIFLNAGASLTVRLTNLEAVAINAQLVLWGYKMELI